MKRTRGSYSTDAIAITEKSEDPERAALVLDYMKGDVNLNRLLLGGIEGKHYSLDSDGNRTTLDGAEGQDLHLILLVYKLSLLWYSQ